MWLHAHFGIKRDFQKAFNSGRRNNGIWVPDGGVCELSGQKEKCELPTQSQLYSWGKRDKVKVKMSPHNLGFMKNQHVLFV